MTAPDWAFALADEVALLMRWSFGQMQAADGGSVHLRPTTLPNCS